MTIAGKESKERKIPTELITSGRRAGRKRERAIFPRNATKERERKKKKRKKGRTDTPPRTKTQTKHAEKKRNPPATNTHETKEQREP